MKSARRLSGISRMVVRSLFGRPATIRYPRERRELPEAARGSVHNDVVRCIFCGQCQRKCPTAAIEVRKGVKEWQIDSLKCCSCRRCVEVCPASCLIMRSGFYPAVTKRGEGVYVVTLAAAQADAYDDEKARPFSAAPPGSSLGSHSGGKPGF